MKNIVWLTVCAGLMIVLASCAEPMEQTAAETQKDYPVTLMTIDPGHFHASLVQKSMYPQVNPTAYVYAPKGQDVQEHLARIKQYNTRQQDPTTWNEVVYTGPDYLQKTLAEKPGNVVMLAGDNQKKIDYIKASVEAGLNVFSDKPMVIDAAGYEVLKQAFETAEAKDVLLYDIMTERYEITTMLQKELAHQGAIFGDLKQGSVEDPSIVKESVHHFFKYVSGNPLKRPAWFFDTAKQGEGIVDVTTHLVDLVMWEAYPEEPVTIEQVKVVGASRWPTVLTSAEFKEVTQEKDYPASLKANVNEENALPVYANGQIDFTVRDVHARVKVLWNYKAPEGAGDTHYSIMKGTKANVIIRQGAEENYRPELFVEAAEGADAAALNSELFKWAVEIQRKFPGVRVLRKGDLWQITIPDRYREGHEAHFARVTEKYLQFLQDGKLPAWEKQNMLTKYHVTTTALEKARSESK